jgi:hypothetical protein
MSSTASIEADPRRWKALGVLALFSCQWIAHFVVSL